MYWLRGTGFLPGLIEEMEGTVVSTFDVKRTGQDRGGMVDTKRHTDIPRYDFLEKVVLG